MQIKHKLFINTAVFLIALSVVLTVFSLAKITTNKLYHIQGLAYEQNINMLSLRRHEKDFLARNDLSYKDKYEKTFQALVKNQTELDALMTDEGIPSDLLNELNTSFSAYRDNFNQIVEANIELGLTPKTGLTGQLRNAVHQIESELNNQNKPDLLITMLQLRRAEKDFMLRSDLKYLDKFSGLIERLKSEINAEGFDQSIQTKLLGLTNSYQTGFNNYVKGAQRIGLSSKDGLLLEMRQNIQKTEGGLDKLIKSLDSEIAKGLQQSTYIAWSASLFIGVLSTIMTLLVNRSISLPLNRIKTAMNNMHKTQNITERLKSDNNDEIKEVADSINTLLDDVQLALEKVWGAADNVTSTAQDLSQTSSSSLKSVIQQREETEVIASSMAEVVGMVDEIFSSMEQVTEMTSNAQRDAQDGKQKVDSAITGIVRLSDRLEGAVETVAQLQKESESIGSVLEVIQGIAEQTNLLALNAAIEAARAGEQGRGFAVVADEVRALASRTHDSTVEISEIIETLQERTKGIVQLVGDCREDGMNSRTDAELIKDVLDTIIKLVMEISSMSSHVSKSLNEQTTATHEVNKSIGNIRTTAEQTAKALEKNDQFSKEILSQSTHLNTALSASKT